ncbi:MULTISPECIES: bifunctional 2-polyprenyl-6-hydroxyphenol methylase/3-demethylubiquinol 3-O-methyltransferase UbiG [Methylobacterium]|jgi:2-polyprenyl-6-hydroxyphenyl methylase/3-demethylubiquinone-9 3-methyltransferase|uniref:bifunctional 2-polyprenyl-6-hydroxyphenol methylase/3-demethylubiquinol 3-O-methyltransferase UbiG n=1 Tax=Methylobacterium TaxID=407 RepID=UPI0008ED8EF7|nr:MULTISPECIES: bifunctional 2-polyprenyl-6-hydroxyphenol methylase/3-demethylubiquinol 3-O-methyltransferase UbiG [Methylobacterium]MBZ6412170.1 bifunctional 2-polyprenyl-6-hydroxyphenol methylase/3-demethylubiquinol 3-O-methyltransferase UbiG [Methylobacterium sp.]MBK3395749.1 bifunctional 2-polyprenyl-6-hydroxyphenol methylase/3-demethylubiquinol 3-O-methyltransferase UbiG [Methylobacterium ajmalii]MBK3410240.1 bifunctional 2-polyprenyl-6-hydroxyphenol methylase/3-demethylubiquinol 3-O-methy
MSEPTGPSIDRDEVARFDRLAATWWDETGPMRVLHRFNPVRLTYIRDTVCRQFGRDPLAPSPLAGLSLVDVGCGGGVLSEPLARLGAEVTGLDPAVTNVKIAQAHADEAGVPVRYRAETIEDVVSAGERFDVVCAMEVVEHVTDMPAFVRTACTAVKPGGLLFAATINRTMRSFALAIVGAEYVLGWLPKGTHDWNKFVTPDELQDAVEGGGLTVTDTTGVVFNPLTNRWSAARDTAVNYMIAAERLRA